MFGQVRQDQPGLAIGGQVGTHAAQKAAQHVAVFVVNGVFNRRIGASRHPGRVADDQRGLAFRKQIGLHQLHFGQCAQALQVVARADQGTRIVVGGDDAFDTAPRQHGRQHARTHANVKGQRVVGRQRRIGHQRHIFTAHWGENAVTGKDAVVRCTAQGLDFDAFFVPFVRADHAQQFAQRGDCVGLALDRPPGLQAGLTQVRCAAQRNGAVGIQRNQQHRQRACALRLGLPMQMESLLWCDGRGFLRARFGARFARFDGGVGTAHHGLQQQACVLKVTAPHHARAFAGQAVGRVGVQGVVGNDHAFGWRCVALRAPQGMAFGALFGPAQAGCGGVCGGCGGRRGR